MRIYYYTKGKELFACSGEMSANARSSCAQNSAQTRRVFVFVAQGCRFRWIRLFVIMSKLITHLVNRFTTKVFAPVGLTPQPFSIPSVLDILNEGIHWATPKRRNSARVIWRKKYGGEWPGAGIKLYVSKRNITTCGECGAFREFHAICRACFEKVQEKTKEVLDKRIAEIDKEQPLWFAKNLRQRAANPREIKGPVREV